MPEPMAHALSSREQQQTEQQQTEQQQTEQQQTEQTEQTELTEQQQQQQQQEQPKQQKQPEQSWWLATRPHVSPTLPVHPEEELERLPRDIRHCMIDMPRLSKHPHDEQHASNIQIQ